MGQYECARIGANGFELGFGRSAVFFQDLKLDGLVVFFLDYFGPGPDLDGACASPGKRFELHVRIADSQDATDVQRLFLDRVAVHQRAVLPFHVSDNQPVFLDA